MTRPAKFDLGAVVASLPPATDVLGACEKGQLRAAAMKIPPGPAHPFGLDALRGALQAYAADPVGFPAAWVASIARMELRLHDADAERKRQPIEPQPSATQHRRHGTVRIY